MKCSSVNRAGFTILETMLFLIITGVLVASALLIFNGRIARTQFNQGVDELNNRIMGTISEVASGTYPTNPPFTCSVSAGVPNLAPAGSTQQGSSSECIFIGKVMQFGVSGTNCSASVYRGCNTLAVHTMFGRRTTSAGTEVSALTTNISNLAQAAANPRLANDPSTVDLTQVYPLPGGMYVRNVVLRDNGTQVGAVGVTQSLGTNSTSGNTTRLNSGAQVLHTWPVGTSWPRSLAQINSLVTSTSSSTNPFVATKADPSGGIVVCLEGGINQKASISIGDNDGRVATRVTKGQDPACP